MPVDGESVHRRLRREVAHPLPLREQGIHDAVLVQTLPDVDECGTTREHAAEHRTAFGRPRDGHRCELASEPGGSRVGEDEPAAGGGLGGSQSEERVAARSGALGEHDLASIGGDP